MKPIICFLFCIVVGCQLSHAQRSDNYRGNLRNRNVKVDATNLKPLIYDIESHNYWTFGTAAGKAFKAGPELMK